MKNIFHIPCWPVGVSTGQNTWYAGTIEEFPWLSNHLPHMPAHSRQSERQNIPNVGIQNSSMWGMYDLSKAYRSMQKSIANRRVDDWEASNGHT